MKVLLFFTVTTLILLIQACGIDGMSPRRRSYSATGTEADAVSEPLTNPVSCTCTYEYRPVCGIKDSVYKTYSNPCAAGCDGLTEVAEGECESEGSAITIEN